MTQEDQGDQAEPPDQSRQDRAAKDARMKTAAAPRPSPKTYGCAT